MTTKIGKKNSWALLTTLPTVDCRQSLLFSKAQRKIREKKDVCALHGVLGMTSMHHRSSMCHKSKPHPQSFYGAPNSLQELPNTLASLFYFFSLIFYFHPCNRLSQKGGPSYSLHFTMVMINIALAKVHKFFPEKIPSCQGFSKHLEVENWNKIIRELRRQVKKKKKSKNSTDKWSYLSSLTHTSLTNLSNLLSQFKTTNCPDRIITILAVFCLVSRYLIDLSL